MCIEEEINNTLEAMGKTFLNRWWQIVTLSFTLLLALPIIEWFVLSILYIIFKTNWLLQKFGDSTAFNLLPWWIDLFTSPAKLIIEYVFCIVLITCIFTWLDSK
jgi:hypothetical protein